MAGAGKAGVCGQGCVWGVCGCARVAMQRGGRCGQTGGVGDGKVLFVMAAVSRVGKA